MAPEAPSRSPRGRALARGLFAIEELPVDPCPPAPPSGRGAALRALFAIEELPVDPEPPAPAVAGRGLLRALLAPESLPEDPEAAPGKARHRWLRWLFRPESLDPPRR